MYIIRPIDLKDLDAFTNLAFMASFGITSMPRNRELLKKKIEVSRASFKAKVDMPKKESYLFVLEDTESKKVGGVCGICSKNGVTEPKYYYQIETIRKERVGLPIPQKIPILKAIYVQNGPTEIGTLFLDPLFRKEGLGRLVSLSRFLFMACFPERFETIILAEMRGYNDKNNKAPFWEYFGSHFLNLEFSAAMHLLEKGKHFIPHIIPDFPVYISLIPKEAQAMIGKVHANTEPALHMLCQEGFIRSNLIDIFDGGPVISASREKIRSVKESKLAKVHEIVADEINSEPFIICNNRLDFRACFGTLNAKADKNAILPIEVAEALQLKKGDIFRYVALPSKKKQGNKRESN